LDRIFGTGLEGMGFATAKDTNLMQTLIDKRNSESITTIRDSKAIPQRV